jgi:hypothetical protein
MNLNRQVTVSVPGPSPIRIRRRPSPRRLRVGDRPGSQVTGSPANLRPHGKIQTRTLRSARTVTASESSEVTLTFGSFLDGDGGCGTNLPVRVTLTQAWRRPRHPPAGGLGPPPRYPGCRWAGLRPPVPRPAAASVRAAAAARLPSFRRGAQARTQWSAAAAARPSGAVPRRPGPARGLGRRAQLH